ncbi:hypothetical protein GCM10027162_49240 [Streptomyces incanus]
MRVRAHGAAENGSVMAGAVTMEVAASADMVVHTAVVPRSRARAGGPPNPSRSDLGSPALSRPVTPGRPNPLGVSRPSPLRGS